MEPSGVAIMRDTTDITQSFRGIAAATEALREIKEYRVAFLELVSEKDKTCSGLGKKMLETERKQSFSAKISPAYPESVERLDSVTTQLQQDLTALNKSMRKAKAEQDNALEQF